MLIYLGTKDNYFEIIAKHNLKTNISLLPLPPPPTPQVEEYKILKGVKRKEVNEVFLPFFYQLLDSGSWFQSK